VAVRSNMWVFGLSLVGQRVRIPPVAWISVVSFMCVVSRAVESESEGIFRWSRSREKMYRLRLQLQSKI
jgi:hypothetical protein